MRKDFVQVKLSAAGEKLAGGAPLHIANAKAHFTFTPGEAQEVTCAYDWKQFLSREKVGDEAMFEVVAEPSILPPDIEKQAHEDAQKFIREHPDVPVVEVPKIE